MKQELKLSLTCIGSEHAMTIRKTVTLVEEINSEYGASVRPPLRRVAIAAAPTLGDVRLQPVRISQSPNAVPASMM